MDPQSTGPINGNADLDINFQLNPAALNELTIDGISGPSDSSDINAFDASVDSAIAGNLNISDGTATVSDFSPFPSGTLYTPSSPSVEFGDAAVTAIVGVPEPASLTGFIIGGIALLGRRRNVD